MITDPQLNSCQPEQNELFAIIDLGSNSFHLLIARHLNGHLYPLSRLRRKVQLASGLDDSDSLSEEAMNRGLECIKLFADRVSHFNPKNVKAVATATLRLAKNRDVFISRANAILKHKIEVIDGEEEARLIYLGASRSITSVTKPFVFDIGGASTEIIVGEGADINYLTSLSVGCVTWKQHYFSSETIESSQFDEAIFAARTLFETIAPNLTHLKWDVVLSACGTVQTLNEILLADKKSPFITRQFLYELKDKLIAFGHVKKINIKGLFFDKTPVLPSGLSILIALFDVFKIDTLIPTDGALREGLMYALQNDLQINEIEQQGLIERIQSFYHVDIPQAKRVRQSIEKFLKQSKQLIFPAQIKHLIISSAELHELGLSLGLKNANQHSSYVLNHFPGAGFSAHEKILLALWLQTLNPQKIKFIQFQKQNVLHPKLALILSFFLKLAVLSCIHRKNDLIAPFDVELLNIAPFTINEVMDNDIVEMRLKKVGVRVLIDKNYYRNHPLVEVSLQELIDEVKYDIKVQITLLE